MAAFATVWLGSWPRPFDLALAALVFLATLTVDRPLARGIAIALALALLALLLTSTRWLPRGEDYTTFYRGAELLLRAGATPYGSAGTVAAPFPTFHLVWLLSGALAVPMETALRLFWTETVIVLATAWALGIVAARRAGGISAGHAVLLVAVAFHPAVALGLMLGQTSAWTMAVAVGAFALWRGGARRAHWLIAGLLLGLGVLLKPSFVLVPLAFALVAVVDLLARHLRPVSRSPELVVGLGALAALPIWLALSWLVSPPAIIEAWQQWPGLAQGWALEVTHNFRGDYAPAAVVAKRLVKHLPLDYGTTLGVLSQTLLAVVVLLNALVLFGGGVRRADWWLPWVFGTLVVSPLTWAHYLVWALPACAWLLTAERGAPCARRFLGRLGFALTFILSSFLFTVGLLLLYLVSLWRVAAADGPEAAA